MGTKTIIAINEMVANNYQEFWIRPVILFARIIGEANYLGFITNDEGNDAPVIDCYCAEIPIEWKSIAPNFGCFLDKLIDNEGDPYWLQSGM